jgi:hypothetical protein
VGAVLELGSRLIDQPNQQLKDAQDEHLYGEVLTFVEIPRLFCRSLQDAELEVVAVQMLQPLDNQGLDAAKPMLLSNVYRAFPLHRVTQLCIMVPVKPSKYYLDLYAFESVPDLQQGEELDEDNHGEEGEGV